MDSRGQEGDSAFLERLGLNVKGVNRIYGNLFTVMDSLLPNSETSSNYVLRNNDGGDIWCLLLRLATTQRAKPTQFNSP